MQQACADRKWSRLSRIWHAPTSGTMDHCEQLADILFCVKDAETVSVKQKMVYGRWLWAKTTGSCAAVSPRNLGNHFNLILDLKSLVLKMKALKFCFVDVQLPYLSPHHVEITHWYVTDGLVEMCVMNDSIISNIANMTLPVPNRYCLPYGENTVRVGQLCTDYCAVNTVLWILLEWLYKMAWFVSPQWWSHLEDIAEVYSWGWDTILQ